MSQWALTSLGGAENRYLGIMGWLRTQQSKFTSVIPRKWDKRGSSCMPSHMVRRHRNALHKTWSALQENALTKWWQADLIPAYWVPRQWQCWIKFATSSHNLRHCVLRRFYEIITGELFNISMEKCRLELNNKVGFGVNCFGLDYSMYKMSKVYLLVGTHSHSNIVRQF